MFDEIKVRFIYWLSVSIDAQFKAQLIERFKKQYYNDSQDGTKFNSIYDCDSMKDWAT